jgi:hypothetical protein
MMMPAAGIVGSSSGDSDKQILGGEGCGGDGEGKMRKGRGEAREGKKGRKEGRWWWAKDSFPHLAFHLKLVKCGFEFTCMHIEEGRKEGRKQGRQARKGV